MLSLPTILLSFWAAVAAPQEQPVFESKVNEVLVPVVVRDAKGRPVANLTKDDFQVFDKGKRQTISSFSAVRSPSGSQSKAGAVATSGSATATPAIAPPGTSFRIYLFDDLHTGFSDMAALRAAAIAHFSQEFFPAGIRAAVQAVSGKPALDFTDDREKLSEAVAKLLPRATLGQGSRYACPNMTFYIADRMINKADLAVQQTMFIHAAQCAHVRKDMGEVIATMAAQQELISTPLDTRTTIAALRRAIRRLAEMPAGQRMIILASPGFHVQDPEALAEVLDLAARAGVVISALDPHGVDPNSDFDANNEGGSRAWNLLRRESLADANDAMADLASGSGGTFFRHNNGLEDGLAQATSGPEASYVLGFVPASLKADGSYHAIRVRLVSNDGLRIEGRRGYFAQRLNARERTAHAEIDDALLSRSETRDIPVVLQITFSKPNGSFEAKLASVAKIDIAGLHFRSVDGHNRDYLTVVSALFNADGGYEAGIIQNVNLRLSEATMEHLDPGVTLRSEFPHLKTGEYVFRLVIRETGGQAMTTISRTVRIP